MASLLGLNVYTSSGESGDDSDTSHNENATKETEFVPKHDVALIISKYNINAAPAVSIKEAHDVGNPIDPTTKELQFNPKYEDLFAPSVGPENPFKTEQAKAHKNTLAGFVEPASFNDFHFESQRRTFSSFGYALDPSAVGVSKNQEPLVGPIEDQQKIVGAIPEDDKIPTVFEKTPVRSGDKRRRHRNNDPADIEGFLGPWGKFENEVRTAKPTPEEQEELQELLSKRQKRGKFFDEKPFEEKTILHIDDPYDYQGRSFLHPPQDTGVNLKLPPDRCYLPKKHIHTWTGHSKGVSAIRWFPRSAHLLLSCSLDAKIKLWEVYKERRCVRTYHGHRQSVRDVSFNNIGHHFVSAGYDRHVKVWDTETGQVIARLGNRKVAYCVRFNPDNDKQHLVVAGTADKKIVCWDVRSCEIVQEYDRHLGAVNSITFVDDGRRFVSTSDDKSVRVWEWNIPVDMKYIADPTMHSMPCVTLSPNGKWLACQSMDNKVVIFSALNRFKLNRKKTFTGHMVAGYACSLDFSPDMSYLISGDADGKLYVWDWKTTKLFSKFKAHQDVCISAIWHPHETSKVATAGWDGLIKFWD